MSKQNKKPKFDLNYPTSAVSVNISQNIRRPIPQVQPHDCQNQAIGLICGGPTLQSFKEEILDRHADGMRFVTLNGSHDWMLDNGMRPSAHVMVDSRPSNARFIKRWHEKTKYLIASQCHPKVFDTLKDANVYIWHACLNSVDRAALDEHYLGRYFTTLGGSTVTLRALSLLRMLGFMKIEVWGFDSCLMDGKHHSYDMPENDGERHATVRVGDKEFLCEPWMLSQAEEFQGLAKALGDELEMLVHGDGLIAHMIKTGASVEKLQEN